MNAQQNQISDYLRDYKEKITTRLTSDYLYRNKQEISDQLSILGHPDRVAILSLVYSEPISFQNLEKHLGISKTALANHLQILNNYGLLYKIRRGEYEISDTSIILLESLKTAFIQIQKLKLQRLQREHLRQFQEVKIMKIDTNTLEKPPVFQSSWITYAGAIAGVLQAFGESYDVVDILGYSGYGFLSNVSIKSTHVAAPTATGFFKQFDEGITSLGYPFHGFWDEGSIFGRQHLRSDQITKLNKQFTHIKNQLDHGNPVILWGIAAAEFGIVTGYEGDMYRVSSFRTYIDPNSETPIHYSALDSPGGLWCYHFGRKEFEISEKTDRDVIHRALMITKGDSGSSLVGVPKDQWEEELMEYYSGPKAFDRWADNLEKGDFDQFGNSYVIACYTEGRSAVGKFFKRLAKRYENRDFHSILVSLQNNYEKTASLLKKVQDVFPFPKGNSKESAFLDAANILRQITTYEIDAIDLLDQCLKHWPR